MKKTKQLGLWMDHSNAIFMELLNDSITEKYVISDFNHTEKDLSLRKNEHLMHNKENQLQASYYKQISDKIRDYDEVLIFGPTNAKDEMYNLIKNDNLFANIKIEVRNSDKMSAIAMQDYVRGYFLLLK